MIKRRIVQIKR